MHAPMRTLGLLLILWWMATPAMAFTVGVMLSDAGPSYTETLEALAVEVRRHPGARIVTATLPPTIGTGTATGAAVNVPEELSNARLLVAIGTRAAQQLLSMQEFKAPIVCILVPRSSFDTLTSRLRPQEAKRVTAVLLDQPPGRQVELIRQLLPTATRVSAVSGSASAPELDRLRVAVEARGMRLAAERVGRESELFAALSRVMPESDAFIALPDPRVLHVETAQNILLTSYRFRTPVIGFSAAYVRAGALAAVVTSPAQAGTQAGEIARAFIRGIPLPAPQHPRAFTVIVNRQVARSLSLEIDDETAIRDRMVRSEPD